MNKTSDLIITDLVDHDYQLKDENKSNKKKNQNLKLEPVCLQELKPLLFPSSLNHSSDFSPEWKNKGFMVTHFILT
jgi:hypothetical protein